jgi:hypothetical protein
VHCPQEADAEEEEAWDTYIMRILPWGALWYTLGYRIPNDFPDMDTNMKGETDPWSSQWYLLSNRRTPAQRLTCACCE